MDNFDLKVGFTCNNYCVHCVITDKKHTADLTTDQIKNIIKNLDGPKDVVFTGGEATIRDDFISLIKYTKKRGHVVSLQTNGARFHDKKFAKEASKWLDYVHLAIHSSSPEVHDKIVQLDGMHEKTINGFRNLLLNGVNVQTQTVLSKLNIHTLFETYQYIQDISPGIRMAMTYPHPNGNAYRNADLVMMRYSDIKFQILKSLMNYAHLLSTEAIPICYLFPFQNLVDNVDEEIMQTAAKGIRSNSSGIDMSNVNGKLFDENGFIQDYQVSNMSERRKSTVCNKCSFNDRCAGVWKEYVEFFGDCLDLSPIQF